jgi:hypothetical protein
MMNMINPHDAESRFDLALSEISSELIRHFHRHWLQICRNGSIPGRLDIDPGNFKCILPNMILAEIERDPFRVRYRPCGTKVTEFCGSLTGRYLDEVATANVWSTAAYPSVRNCGDPGAPDFQLRLDAGPVRGALSVPDRHMAAGERWPDRRHVHCRRGLLEASTRRSADRSALAGALTRN